MNYKSINNITGWVVCIIACAVYIITMEATGSLWDCGEFASCAYKLQIPHPPGAPLFVLIGRLFMVPFDAQNASTGVNLMSALASGFTILFLFWSITHFAKKLVVKNSTAAELSGNEIFGIMSAGAVGALAYTFSDTFWYSAVESEVYALSSFFTAIVVWAMLKWENAVTEEQKAGVAGHFTGADRWLILIFYLMGLSIGVHLLNLLTIPAMVMLYYFKRYKVTTWGGILAFVVGCAITGIVQKFVIQYSIKGAGAFDVIFVNDFGLPFFTGFAFFFLLIAVLIHFGLRWANNNNWNFLKLSLWSFSFMLIGYSSYLTTLIRSNADTAVDMYNVDNPATLVGYLSREQYGETPILFGPDFTAGNVSGNEYQPEYITEETYIKTKNGYEKKGRKTTLKYNTEDEHFFPRMWDSGNEQGHADYYASFAGITKDQKGNYSDKPTFGDNVRFFTQYQMGWMYLRYFMWNFAGKQNDIQGVITGNVRDGNWKSGIGFIDNALLGDQKLMPDSMKNNKANNKLYFLPLILGLIGLYYQFKKDNRDAIVVGLLFFFTGAAIVIYLNMPGNMPRERDYAFVGSFYAFAFWIGLGVLAVKDFFGKYLPATIATGGSAVLCTLAVPVLMANVEWDDHDRGRKTIARDLAINYLESCEKNAIVISFGDNDTYPLWYAQEVEGIRRDVRVINSSLLGIDWYINQLRYKLNQSPPIDPIWSAEQIEGSKRDGIYFVQKPGIDQTQPMDLLAMMRDYAGSDAPDKTEQTRDGMAINTFPTHRVSVPVDMELVRKNGTVNAEDSVVSQLVFDIPRNVIQKNDAAILNIIAANKWKRPIYFTSERANLGFDKYIRQDGLTYRLVPVENGQVNRPWVIDKMSNKFVFGNADKAGVYFDEENRRHLNSIRLAYASAAANLADHGKKDEARKLLNKCDKNMDPGNFGYGSVSRFQQHNYISFQFLEACYKAGDTVLAQKVAGAVKKDLEQQFAYYASLGKMSVQDLQLNLAKSVQFRYQNERDEFLYNLDRKLRPVYEDAERGFQILKNIESLQRFYSNPQVSPQDLQNKITNQP
jgi:hypothetical protein